MDPKWQFVFFTLAILCLLMYAIGWTPRRVNGKYNLMALGLAIALVPFAYSAVVAGW